jgi:hypothetical protein
VSSLSKLYPNDAIAKLVAIARGNFAWWGTMSRNDGGGRCTCFGDDGVVVNAVSSLVAATLLLVAISLFVLVETMYCPRLREMPPV